MHVGTHKTGSTSIQMMLAMLVEKLEALGTGVINTGRNSEGGHHNLAWECWGDRRFRAELGGFAELEQEMATREEGQLVISAESFTAHVGNQLACRKVHDIAAQSGREVRILAYVRPQHLYMDSLYVQQVKMGYHSKPFGRYLDDVIDLPRFDYLQVFGNWKRQFGDSVQVFPFERSALPNGILMHFLEQLGVDQLSSLTEDVPRMNERVGAKQLEVLRLVTRTYQRRHGLRRAPSEVMRALRKKLPKILIDDPLFRGLDEQSTRRILDKYSDRNALFAREFAISSAGELFQDIDDPSNNAPTQCTWESLDQEERREVRRVVKRVAGIALAVPKQRTLNA